MEVSKYMARIAVEKDLEHVRDVLQKNGHDVVSLEGEEVPSCDCCVISGLDQNMMGMSNRATDVSVINIDGMTDEQILREIKERIQL